MVIPKVVYLFRITHYNNLPFILQNGIHSPSSPEKDPNYINIGKKNIIEKRENLSITCPPHGVLHDYVSFYFGPRSPMLYSIHKGYSNTPCTQEEIIYLITSIPTLQQAGLSFVFTNGQALMALSQQYQEIKDLDKIDWDIIFGKYWHDIPPQITDRKRKRQAELLVHQHLPLSNILGIIVLNKKTYNIVSKMISDSGKLLSIHIKPDWYY